MPYKKRWGPGQVTLRAVASVRLLLLATMFVPA